MRFTPLDNLSGTPVIIGPFELDTRAGGAIDVSPPDYVSPPPGTIFYEPTVTLQWTPRLGAANYRLEISTDPSFGTLVGGSGTITSSTQFAADLADDRTYYWRVRYKDDHGAWSAWASSRSFTTREVPPTITTDSPLPSGTVGIAYASALAADGGTMPYTWSVSAGTLPDGLAITSIRRQQVLLIKRTRGHWSADAGLPPGRRLRPAS